jgi:hypothetical protein
VLFGVDAGALLASLKLAKKYKQGGNCLDHEDRFDRVVFNFPHTGLGIKVRSGTGWGSQAARADSRQHSLPFRSFSGSLSQPRSLLCPPSNPLNPLTMACVDSRTKT